MPTYIDNNNGGASITWNNIQVLSGDVNANSHSITNETYESSSAGLSHVAWDAAHAYVVNDVVADTASGNFLWWICKQNNTNQEPPATAGGSSSYWKALPTSALLSYYGSGGFDIDAVSPTPQGDVIQFKPVTQATSYCFVGAITTSGSPPFGIVPGSNEAHNTSVIIDCSNCFGVFSDLTNCVNSISMGSGAMLDANNGVMLGGGSINYADNAISLGGAICQGTDGTHRISNPISIGTNCQATASNSIAFGTLSLASRKFQEAFAGFHFAVTGDAQADRIIMGAFTSAGSNAAPFLSDGTGTDTGGYSSTATTPNAATVLAVPANSASSYEITIQGRQSGGSATGYWKRLLRVHDVSGTVTVDTTDTIGTDTTPASWNVPTFTAKPRTLTKTGAAYNNSTSVTGLSNTTDLYIGDGVSGTGIQAGTTIAAVTSASAITLSLATTGGSQSGQTLTFDHGVGVLAITVVGKASTNITYQAEVRRTGLVY